MRVVEPSRALRAAAALIVLICADAAAIPSCQGADLSRLGSSSARGCAPYASQFSEGMRRHGMEGRIDPAMLYAQVLQESSCNPTTDCGGIMQVDFPCKQRSSPQYCACKGDVNLAIDLGMRELRSAFDSAQSKGASSDDALTFVLFGYNRGQAAMADAIAYRKSGLSASDAMMKSCRKWYGPGTSWNNANYYCEKKGMGPYYPQIIYDRFDRLCRELGGSPKDVAALSPSAGGVNCPSYVTNSQFVWPVQGRISSRFGPRTPPCPNCGSNHEGLDIAQSEGTPVVAAASGKVSFAGTATGYGNVVYIDHPGGVQTRYAHASKLLVSTGQDVSQGSRIMLVGSTGYSTGPHLHFEVRVRGKAIDPLPELERGGAGTVHPRNDIDADGICNDRDDDIDGDDIANDRDDDIDGDGIANSLDNDSDNDGTPDDQEPAECKLLWDCDGDSIPDAKDAEPRRADLDLDGDCIPNMEDDDWDNDGVPNDKDDKAASPCAGCQVVAGAKGGADETRAEMCVTGPCDVAACTAAIKAGLPSDGRAAAGASQAAVAVVLKGAPDPSKLPYLATRCQADAPQRETINVAPIAAGPISPAQLDTALLTCPERTYDNVNEYRRDLLDTLGRMRQFYMALKGHMAVVKDALDQQEARCKDAIAQFTQESARCKPLALDPEKVASPDFSPKVCAEAADAACPKELALCPKEERPAQALARARECSLCIVLNCCPGERCEGGVDPADPSRCEDANPVEGDCSGQCEEGCPKAERSVPPSGCAFTPREQPDKDLGVVGCDASGQPLVVSCCLEREGDRCKDGKERTDTDKCSAVVRSGARREHALVFPRALESCYQKAADLKDLCTVDGSEALGDGRTHSPGYVAARIERIVRFLDHYDKVYPSLEAAMRKLAEAEEGSLKQGAAASRRGTLDQLLSIEKSSKELASDGATSLAEFQKLTGEVISLARQGSARTDVSSGRAKLSLSSSKVRATEGWRGARLCLFDGSVDTPAFDEKCASAGPARREEIAQESGRLSCAGCAAKNPFVGRCLSEPAPFSIEERGVDQWPDPSLGSLISIGRLDPQAVFLDSRTCFDYRGEPATSGQSGSCARACAALGAAEGYCHPESGVCVCPVEGVQQTTSVACEERVDEALRSKLAACCERLVGKPSGADASSSASDGAKADAVVATARGYLGWRYEMSSRVPYCSGGACYIDCSSLTQQVFRKHGISIPRTAEEQFSWCQRNGKLVSEPQKGDAVYFKNTYKQGISHTGIWLGEGRYLHAAGTAYGVIISTLTPSYKAAHWAGACRLAGDVKAAAPASFGLCRDGSGDLCCTGRGLEKEVRLTPQTCDVSCEEMCAAKHSAGSSEAVRCIAGCSGNTCLGRPDGTKCEGGLCFHGQCAPGATSTEGPPCEGDDAACQGGWCCDKVCLPGATACAIDPCARKADGTACTGGLCCEGRCAAGAMACSAECASRKQGEQCQGVDGRCCDTTCIPNATSCGEADPQCSARERVPCVLGAERGLCCDGRCVPNATACAASPSCAARADGERCSGGTCCSGSCVAEATGCSTEDRCQTICFDRLPGDVAAARACTARCNAINVTCERSCLESRRGVDCMASCGDGLDNDGDGAADEDASNEADDDGDGRLDEDGAGHDIPRSAVRCMEGCVQEGGAAPSARAVACVKACRALAPSLRVRVALSDGVRSLLVGERFNVTARVENAGVFPFEGTADLEAERLVGCSCAGGRCPCMRSSARLGTADLALPPGEATEVAAGPAAVEQGLAGGFVRPRASAATAEGDVVVTEIGELASVLARSAIRDAYFVALPGNGTVREAFPGDRVAGAVVAEAPGGRVRRAVTHDGNVVNGTEAEGPAAAGPLQTRALAVPAAMAGTALGLSANVRNATGSVVFDGPLPFEGGGEPCRGSVVTEGCVAFKNAKVFPGARLYVRALALTLTDALFIGPDGAPVRRSAAPLKVRASVDLEDRLPRPFSGSVELSVVTSAGATLSAANHTSSLASGASASVASGHVEVPADTTALIRVVARAQDGTVWLDEVVSGELFPYAKLVVEAQKVFGEVDIDSTIVYGDCALRARATRCLATCELHVDKDACTIEPKECGCVPAVERLAGPREPEAAPPPEEPPGGG